MRIKEITDQVATFLSSFFPFLASFPKWVQIFFLLVLLQLLVLVFAMVAARVVTTWNQQVQPTNSVSEIFPMNDLENLVFHAVLKHEDQSTGTVKQSLVIDDIERIKFKNIKSVTILAVLNRFRKVGLIDYEPETGGFADGIIIIHDRARTWSDPIEEPLERWPKKDIGNDK